MPVPMGYWAISDVVSGAALLGTHNDSLPVHKDYEKIARQWHK